MASIIRLLSGDWLWRVIIGWLGRGVITGVIAEVELKGTLLDWWLLSPQGHERQIMGCWRLKPSLACVHASVLGEMQRRWSHLNLLYYPAIPLSSPSDLGLSFLSPTCLSHLSVLSLSGLINNEWSRSSIDPILFVLAQQKISNLSEGLKIALWYGQNSVRVCWVKSRGFLFLWSAVKGA